ncbi:MAG: 16S rRNA (uracil(1498)-N(3))-methyltransferase [Oliverpabstia sp.]|nr:16S rRNA (uracil(1498)-N(3))-methyltransferase [Lachnospiraceae bacterium]MDY5026002.1 16S rRNA (uracil(1498)-N(3))-methyltransferase [Oliverpabstia sp.]
MYRFFVGQSQIDPEQKKISITGSDVNHIKNVLRMKNGEEVLISDGECFEYICRIDEMNQGEIRLSITGRKEADRELPSRIYLFQGLPKSDKMELIIQKAVELGVYEIIPVDMKRTVVKFDGKKQEAKLQRWQGISESAAKQSKRIVVPQIHPVMKFSEALKYAENLDVRLMPYELAENMQYTRKILGEIQPGHSIGIFIGPEGGFAPEEVEAALQSQVQSITLGKRILRTETAGITVLSILMFLMEDKKTVER